LARIFSIVTTPCVRKALRRASEKACRTTVNDGGTGLPEGLGDGDELLNSETMLQQALPVKT
jgi:hypothetical protein